MLTRMRPVIIAVGFVSTLIWGTMVVDNYFVHVPYAWGHTCIPCYNYVYYVYNFGYYVAYPGFVAALFFAVFLVCLLLLWLPRKGLLESLVRTFLIVAPAVLFVWEIGMYFFLNFWWTIHATNFLARTPFTNEAVFWTSAFLLIVGVTVELVRRR